MNMVVYRVLGLELVRDGGSLWASFETGSGPFGIFFKIEIADQDSATKVRLGYAEPLLIDLDPSKRPQDTERVTYGEFAGPMTSISWQQARALLAEMAETAPALGELEVGLLDEMKYVADNEGALPPGRARLMEVNRWRGPTLGGIVSQPKFQRLNEGWNAEPNAPAERVTASGDQVKLRFYLNCSIFYCDVDEQQGELTFTGVSKWRLGGTNDEGWSRGQCRYSRIAPAWGEFYLVSGDDPKRDLPDDWRIVEGAAEGAKHFLFYLRGSTFECLANDWAFERCRSGLGR